MMSIREKFEIPQRYKLWSYALMAVGVISIIVLFITHGASGDDHEKARFWSSLLQNSVFFLLLVNASMFMICATILAWAGWNISFRRVSEAIAACVPVIGVICGVILLAIVFGGEHAIYHWADDNAVRADHILEHKSPFLNKTFFTIWTVLTIGLWSFLGWKIRQLSLSTDAGKMTVEEGKRFQWTNTVWAAGFLFVFALTVMSTTPWLWLMSIDAHWYSTMYSWYTFASTFVSGIALIALFVIYLKNKGYLEYTNEEHLHDLGKFMFAFSVFWCYLWFSQYMLIWYSNQPEETKYFEPRVEGPYRGIFFLNIIINFIAPLLLLMRRGAKRNYTTVTIMAVLIIFGHWLDFFQMVHPATSVDHVPMMLYDLGIGLGFVGLILFIVGRTLAKHPLVPKNHPFFKESVIHHT
ncbi:MAG TPA: quinol:cytochrome C oxidoreductase [Chitinophagaceae bacterium]|nr:quinol:cytochrome C oxidoreductase [Chitinophagaceae bacterium]